MSDCNDNGRPEPGKLYSLTGLGASIANGNSWAESEVEHSDPGKPTVDAAIASYCAALTSAGTCASIETVRYEPDPRGKKYTRIVRVTESKSTGEVTSRSAAAFVKREDGSIWKPDGWKGPTLNFARGNVYNPSGYANHLHGYGL